MKGLSAQEAAARLRSEGPNELPSKNVRSPLRIAFELIREPMILLLVACAILYLFLGDLREALLLAGSVGLVIGIGLVQQNRTERALEALRDLSSPRALVIRDGKRMRIPSPEVVRGDLILLVEGDRVPADARVISCADLSVDESLLTGESVPVRKTASPDPKPVEPPSGEDLPFVFAGTLIVRGEGFAEVQATGARTEMGKIGKSLQNIGQQETRLQKEIRRIVRVLSVAALLVCALVAVLHGLLRGNWVQGFLAGLTLAISLIPEEFPVVLTVFLALGAWRISRSGVLTRQMPALEMLGAATVLCADKTGTLTLNKMRVQRLAVNGSSFEVPGEGNSPLPEPFAELASCAVLASHSELFDPMEIAIHALLERVPAQNRPEGWTFVRRYPLSRELLAMSQAWRRPGLDALLVAAKGAPEAISDLCKLAETRRRQLSETAREMAGKGLRVLGVAKAEIPPDHLPNRQEEISFSLVGLIGLSDPIRPSAPKAVQECRRAGIRVVMITGDYPETAREIGRQIGLESPERVLTGKELDALDDAAFLERVRNVQLFARIVPEQKLRLVNALKADGQIVAMTGDGVNDAPALKSAHIGIAMGGRGTDVAREAASLVLLNDDFTSIVRAIRLGRRVFDNLRKAMGYLFAIHMPIAGMALIPILLRGPLVLLPMHIVFLEIIIDPACSIVFEAGRSEEDEMHRPPRDPKEPLFTRKMVSLGVLQGAGALGAVLLAYLFALSRGMPQSEVRAMAFTTMILANLMLIVSDRSWSSSLWKNLRSSNPAFWWVLGGTLTILGLILYLPVLQNLFQLAPLTPGNLAVCLGAGLLALLWFEKTKRIVQI